MEQFLAVGSEESRLDGARTPPNTPGTLSPSKREMLATAPHKATRPRKIALPRRKMPKGGLWHGGIFCGSSKRPWGLPHPSRKKKCTGARRNAKTLSDWSPYFSNADWIKSSLRHIAAPTQKLQVRPARPESGPGIDR